MKKTTLIAIAMLFGSTLGNVYANIPHGSISKKGLSVTKIQEDPNNECPDETEITIDFKLVSLNGTTYAYLNGEGYTLADSPWAAQIRYGTAEKQCPVDNRKGNLCIWSYADHNNMEDKVSAVVEHNNNFYQTTESFTFDMNACNSKDENDKEAPVLSEATATADETSVTINAIASDDSEDFFFHISSGDITVIAYETETVIDGLKPGTEYTFTITAIDFSGNESESKEVTIKTAGEPLAPSQVETIALNILTKSDKKSNHSNIFLTGEAMPFTVEVKDQYGEVMTDVELIYNASEGAVDEAAKTVTWTTAGTKTLQVNAGEKSESIEVLVVDNNPIEKASWTATASSTANDEMTAQKAIDGDENSRWTSGVDTQEGVAQPETLDIDMGASYQLTAIEVMWEGATAKDYDVLVSADGENYTNLGGERRDVGIVNHLYRVKAGEEMDVRYIRIDCQVPATVYKYSIFEVTAHQVKGDDPTTSVAGAEQSSIQIVSTVINDNMLRLSEEASFVQVYSLQGQLVLSQQNTNCLSMDRVSKGLYIVKLTDGAGKQSATKIELR